MFLSSCLSYLVYIFGDIASVNKIRISLGTSSALLFRPIMKGKAVRFWCNVLKWCSAQA